MRTVDPTRPPHAVRSYRNSIRLVRAVVEAAAVATTVVCATSVNAKLGETVPELTKRFGRPYETVAADGGGVTYSFHERGCDVEVVVSGDKSVQETYYSYQPLQPDGNPPSNIVRGILQTNVPGAKWKDAQIEGGKEEAAFATADGKYRASIFRHAGPSGTTVNSTFVVLVRRRDVSTFADDQTAQGGRTTASQTTPVPSVAGSAKTTQSDVTSSSEAASETDSEEVYMDPAAERDKALRALSKEDRTKAVHAFSNAELDELLHYRGHIEAGKLVLFTPSELKANAALYSQACNLAMGKLRGSFIRKVASEDSSDETDSFVTKVGWKAADPSRQRIIQFKNVTFRVEPEQLTEVDRMNGWRWRGRVTFSAKYMRGFIGTNASSFGESASGGLRAYEWEASRNFLHTSLTNRDDKWTLSVPDEDTEYRKPSEAEMKEYDAAAEKGTRSR